MINKIIKFLIVCAALSFLNERYGNGETVNASNITTLPSNRPTEQTEKPKQESPIAKKTTGRDWLKDIIDNKEQRKAEIDKIAEVVDAGINVQMKRVSDIAREIADLNATTKRTIGQKLEEINRILTGMDAVDFRLKTLYPDQLKIVESWAAFHKNLP